MLVLLSPAKTLDLSPQSPNAGTKPAFHAEANRLAKAVAQLSPGRIAKLMSISAPLAASVHDFYASWKSKYDPRGAKEAIFAFRGDVYQGLAVDDFTAADLAFSQKHLRILSGLYGVLRPLDLIQPYRLEMGTRLRTDAGRDLYAYWGERLADCLRRELSKHRERIVVNLASDEYFNAVPVDELDARVVSPAFKEFHNGKYLFLSFFGKKARGLMARHLIQSRGDDLDAVLAFRAGGYRFNPELSTDDRPVFTRNKPTT